VIDKEAREFGGFVFHIEEFLFYRGPCTLCRTP
jgi:hypothetical protein